MVVFFSEIYMYIHLLKKNQLKFTLSGEIFAASLVLKHSHVQFWGDGEMPHSSGIAVEAGKGSRI